jgi:hypothetical protein
MMIRFASYLYDLSCELKKNQAAMHAALSAIVPPKAFSRKIGNCPAKPISPNSATDQVKR